MKRRLTISIVLFLLTVCAMAENNTIVRRLTIKDITQNQTASAVAYNLVNAIIQRDFYRVLSYADLKTALEIHETMREKYPDFQDGIDFFFSIESLNDLKAWQPALESGYEVAVIDSIEDIREAHVYLICCPSSEIGRKTVDEITRYNDTNVKVILRRTNNQRWWLHDIYFYDGTEVTETEEEVVAEAPADYDIEIVSEEGDDDFVLVNEPEYETNGLNDYSEAEDDVYRVVDKMPSFPGGVQALFKYLDENVEYPVIAQQNGIEGRSIVEFVVEKDGSISDIVVIRSAGDESLDREAVRVIRSMPRWSPGSNRGKVVRVSYTIPINFRLQ